MKLRPLHAVLAVTITLVLSSCGTAPPANRTAPQDSLIPVPILEVGEPFAVDLLGDGQVTVTVAATERASIPAAAVSSTTDSVRLVVSIRILLNKPGNPITGGPQNFRFRDGLDQDYEAQTSAQAFPPELAPVALTTAGQRIDGKLFFDVPAASIAGGHIQLVSGRLVHALWKV